MRRTLGTLALLFFLAGGCSGNKDSSLFTHGAGGNGGGGATTGGSSSGGVAGTGGPSTGGNAPGGGGALGGVGGVADGGGAPSGGAPTGGSSGLGGASGGGGAPSGGGAAGTGGAAGASECAGLCGTWSTNPSGTCTCSPDCFASHDCCAGYAQTCDVGYVQCAANICSLNSSYCCIGWNGSAWTGGCGDLGSFCGETEIYCNGAEDCGAGEICCGTLNPQLTTFTKFQCMSPGYCQYDLGYRVICQTDPSSCPAGFVCKNTTAPAGFQYCGKP